MTKGFLKSVEGSFQLGPKVTTIGREGCDLVIENPSVDQQHALLEFSDNESCFVLQDLNSREGTFVNDCRVQNAAVRLAAGDVVRFGYSGIPYELLVEQTEQISIPSVHQRSRWASQPLTVLEDEATTQQSAFTSMPRMKVVAAPAQPWLPVPQTPLPRPPPATSLRSRPLSAGSALTTNKRTITTDRVLSAHATISTGSNQRSVSGWVTTPQLASTGRGQGTGLTTGADLAALQEREQQMSQQLNQLGAELQRLVVYEDECQRKDNFITQLKEEIGDLHGRLRQAHAAVAPVVASDPEVTQKLLVLENEVTARKIEVNNLKEQISTLQRERPKQNGVSIQDYHDRILEMNSLKVELEKVHKEKNVTSGLVSQMQRDMSNKDVTISRLTREIENHKKTLEAKDVEIISLRSKFQKTQESVKTKEDGEAKDKELALLRQKFKAAETKMQEQAENQNAMKQEIDKLRKSCADEKEKQKNLQSEMDHLKTKCLDIERADRVTRVDLEQMSKRLERFRSRVVQVTFSTPGIRAPDKEISDDELLETLKNIIDERTHMVGQAREVKDTVAQAHAERKEVVDSVKKLKQQVRSTTERLREKGRQSGVVKVELEILQAVALEEATGDLRTALVELLRGQLAWEEDVEEALQRAGLNVKLEDSVANMVSKLHGWWKRAAEESDALRDKLAELSEANRREVDTARQLVRRELEEERRQEVERLKILGQEQVTKACEEVRALEEDKRHVAVQAERVKIADLEAALARLTQSILDKDGEQDENKEVARLALEEVAGYKILEAELRRQIGELQAERSGAEEKVRRDMEESEKRMRESEALYKEQIRQHSVTIVAMEEKLVKLNKKNKDHTAEVDKLKQALADAKKEARSVPPPKPKVIVQRPLADIASLEAALAQLQRDNAALGQEVTQQKKLVTSLRHDLAGAQARLSDVTGELSEQQKEEVERSRSNVRDKEREAAELRQQLAKLSLIVDKQAAEMKELNTELGLQKGQAGKYRNSAAEFESQCRQLQAELDKEKDQSVKNLQILEDEGRITSELSAAGAQCRGERHDQVIARQREALTELRARVKALEQLRPPKEGSNAVPTHDQALQQVILLKKELSELRAAQAQVDIGEHLVHAAGEQLGLPGLPVRSVGAAEAEMERSAHRETLEALENSEGSYLALLRAMASSVELDEVPGLRSMGHIPRDERRRLAEERERACEMLANRIKVLKERIMRKDELLQGYERDLARLRQAEELAKQRQSQVDSLSNDLRARNEETLYLRDCYQKARDGLDQEKRLNSAIKNKKTFHLEHDVARNGFPRHHCPPDDVKLKDASKKKAQTDKLKRKDYELKVLKKELSSTDRDLHDARRRILTLENNLGLDTGRSALDTPNMREL